MFTLLGHITELLAAETWEEAILDVFYQVHVGYKPRKDEHVLCLLRLIVQKAKVPSMHKANEMPLKTIFGNSSTLFVMTSNSYPVWKSNCLLSTGWDGEFVLYLLC